MTSVHDDPQSTPTDDIYTWFYYAQLIRSSDRENKGNNSPSRYFVLPTAMDPAKFTSFVIDTFKKRTRIKYVSIDNKAFSLHYRLTSTIFLVCSTLLTIISLFGKETRFACIKSLPGGDAGKVEQSVIDNYCWIEGTFIFPRSILEAIKLEETGWPTMPHRGLYNAKDVYRKSSRDLPPDEVMTTTYYYWVPVVLFLQSLTWFIPHKIWKDGCEKGLQKRLVEQLFKPVYDKTQMAKHQKALIEYLYLNRGCHNRYALKYFLCEVLNLVHILIQFKFMDWFLGGNFWSYGWTIATSTETRPMERVFPTMTKCRFYKYGPSGDIQHYDNLCILPLNIINEKIYLLIWWWLIFLSIITTGSIILSAFSILFHGARYYSLASFNRMVPEGPYKKVLQTVSYGDWFLLYLFARNLDPFHYRSVMMQLAERIDQGKSTSRKDDRSFDSSLLNSEERNDSSSTETADQQTSN